MKAMQKVDTHTMPAHALSGGGEWPNHHKSPTEAKSPASPHTFLPESQREREMDRGEKKGKGIEEEVSDNRKRGACV